MTKFVFILAVSWSILSSTYAQPSESFFDKFDRFLKKYSERGSINFDRLKTEPDDLNALYQMIGTAYLQDKDRAYTKAFLINAYNILVIKQEQVFYPIKSPLEINGFFNNIVHNVAGREYTLDALEKQFLLKEFPDARVHLVLVCGAKGCPKLFEKAYRPESLDVQIDEQVTRILNDPEFLIVSDDKSNIALSEIFKWYQQDFTQTAPTVLEYINGYRTDKIPSESEISFYQYDWSINNISKEE